MNKVLGQVTRWKRNANIQPYTKPSAWARGGGGTSLEGSLGLGLGHLP